MQLALQASVVFGSLHAEVIEALVNAVQWQQVQGGESVFREGEPADSVVFVINGGLRASRTDRQGQVLLYNQVHPGQSVGELGMILQQPRAQDVFAVRDSTLAVLSRNAYEALLIRYPVALNRVFLKAVHDQLRLGTEVQENGHTQTIAIVPLDAQAGSATLAASLVAALAVQAARSGDSLGHLTEHAETGQTLLNGRLIDARNGELPENQHRLLVFEASAQNFAWARYAIRQADQVVFVACSNQPPSLRELERQIVADPGYALKRKHLVLMHGRDQVEPESPLAWAAGRDLERIYPLREGVVADAEHLARFLTGTAVGLVLGGGGARGFAHLGVLRALNQANIPVDLIGGNSMGALIGAQLACGHTLDQILKQTQKFAAGGEWPTLPLVSLVSGRRVERDLKKLFGVTPIEQLWRPFFAAACNLSRGCTMVQDQGPLWRAVLASNSPAGLFPPVLHHGDLLVDGAILENVPVQPMRLRLGTALERRRGNGTIIAVDVDVPSQLRADPRLLRLGPMSMLKKRLMKGAPEAPSLAEILYSAGHVGSLNQRPRTISQADLYLEPPVGEFPLMAYARAADIAEVGYRYAMEKISQWEQQKTS